MALHRPSTCDLVLRVFLEQVDSRRWKGRAVDQPVLEIASEDDEKELEVQLRW